MSDLLKGNFKIKKQVKDSGRKNETLEDRFEREALKRLGGSIAYVSKRKVVWEKPKAEGKGS